MWFWILIISFSSNGPFFDEIDYPITPDNYHEYKSMIPNRIYNSFRLAVAEPSILQPCDSTIWYLGDSMAVSWQGASLFGRTIISQLIDSVRVTFPLPSWYYVMELYQNGDYIETLSPINCRDRSEPLATDPLDNGSRSFMSASYPLEEIGNLIEDNTPGSGFQIRMIIWDQTGFMGNVDHDKCIELWSNHFIIDDPWLEVVTPNASTIWREDSSDAYVEFISHGLFGYESSESVLPNILLFKGNEEIRPFHVSRSFTQGALDNNAIVDGDWGNGTGFRICLEMDGERFFSDSFDIFGQTIRILNPDSYLISLDSQIEIEWCSSSASDILVNLFGSEIEACPLTGTTVSIELYGMDESNGTRFLLATLAFNIQNDGLFVYEKSYKKEWVGIPLFLKITDCDGNYGWSRVINIQQQSRHWH